MLPKPGRADPAGSDRPGEEPEFRETDLPAVGWPAIVFIPALAGMLIWQLVAPPWSYALFGLTVMGLGLLVRSARKSVATFSVRGSWLTIEIRGETARFDLATVVDLSYDYVIHSGPEVYVTCADGSAFRVHVDRGSERLRRAISAAILRAQPGRIIGDHRARRALYLTGAQRFPGPPA